MKKKPKTAASSNSSSSYLDNFRHLLPADEIVQLAEELKKPLKAGIRINLIKENPVTIEELVSRYGWELSAVPYCKSGWQVNSSPHPISQTIEQRFGYYYIQEAASMLPAELFNFSSTTNPVILDMAASPGGKTTHLADRTKDQGLIVANDNSPNRITALKLILQTWGVLNQAITQFPGEKYGQWFPEQFDFVLLDAPCSMQGLQTTRRHPMRPVTPKEINNLARRQTRLLTSALQAVQTGGQVVYSTCTLQPEENEAVLDTLLKEHPHLFSIETLENILPRPAPALAGDGTRTFNPDVVRAARFWPHRYGTSGFFAALLRKIEPFPEPSPEPAPSSSLQANGYEQVSSAKLRDLADIGLQVYGFNLPASLERFNLLLWKKGNIYYAFPERFFTNAFNFPVRSLGLTLGENTPDGLIFSHEWISRFFDHFSGQRLVLAADMADLWVKGMDIRDTAYAPASGKIINLTDDQGRFLGRGKVLPDRIKNLIPHRSILQ